MRQPSQRETAVFESLCGLVAGDGLVTLRRSVAQHLGELRLAARTNELLAIDLAEELADKLDGLLEELPTLPEETRKLVVGAARYFVSYDDALPDRNGPLGLDDDVAVFNTVARRIGRAELEISE